MEYTMSKLEMFLGSCLVYVTYWNKLGNKKKKKTKNLRKMSICLHKTFFSKHLSGICLLGKTKLH